MLLLLFTQVLSLWGEYHVIVQEGCLPNTQSPLLCYGGPHPSIPTPFPVMNLNYSQQSSSLILVGMRDEPY